MLVVFTFLIRLQAAQALIVPSYFDSAEHVRLIQALAGGASPFDIWRGGYYHLGYHAVIAAAVHILGADPIRAVLVSGALLLALWPLGVFWLLRRVTTNTGALFGAFLAAWGWSMPAYALNWGKYPLLAGLVLLTLTLAAGRAALTNRRWLPVFGLLAVLTPLFHTRLLAVMGLFVLDWLAAPKLARLPRYLSIGLPLAAVAGLSALTAADPLLDAAFNPYLRSGWPISTLVLLLVPFAYRTHTQTVQAMLLMMAALLAGLHLPAGWVIPGHTVLDRPLVETVLCLPLAVLGGLGLDSLPRAVRPRWAAVLAAASFTLFFLNAAWTYNPRPACCVIFSEADAVALDWMSAHLPPGVHILTAAVEMRVSPQTTSAPLAGSDAGVWIPTLAGRSALPAPYTTDFSAADTWQTLCGNAIGYIYIGGAGQSFDAAGLESRPGWYVRVFSMPPASLYQVIGCGD